MINNGCLVKGQRKIILVVKSQSKYLASQHFDFTTNDELHNKSKAYFVYNSIHIDAIMISADTTSGSPSIVAFTSLSHSPYSNCKCNMHEDEDRSTGYIEVLPLVPHIQPRIQQNLEQNITQAHIELNHLHHSRHHYTYHIYSHVHHLFLNLSINP